MPATVKLTVTTERPTHPSRLGRCKKCRVVYQWSETPEARNHTRMGRDHVWEGLACPGCKGPLTQTTSLSKETRCFVRVEAVHSPYGDPTRNFPMPPGYESFASLRAIEQARDALLLAAREDRPDLAQAARDYRAAVAAARKAV